MVALGRDVSADDVYFAVVDPIPGRTDCLLLSQEQREKTLEAIDEAGRSCDLPIQNIEDVRRRLSDPSADSGRYDAGAVNEIPCYIGWLFCRIMANGDVVPCCRAVRMPMGNLNQASLPEIWHSDLYGEFRHNALALPKDAPFFSCIGCEMTCDNFMHNMDMHGRLGMCTDACLESTAGQAQA